MLEALDFFELELIFTPNSNYSLEKDIIYKGGLHMYNDNSVVGYLEENDRITHMIAGAWIAGKGIALIVCEREGELTHFHLHAVNTNNDFNELNGQYVELDDNKEFNIKGDCKAILKSVLNNPVLRDSIITKHINETKLLVDDNIDLFFYLDDILEKENISRLVEVINKL